MKREKNEDPINSRFTGAGDSSGVWRREQLHMYVLKAKQNMVPTARHVELILSGSKVSNKILLKIRIVKFVSTYEWMYTLVHVVH